MGCFSTCTLYAEEKRGLVIDISGEQVWFAQERSRLAITKAAGPWELGCVRWEEAVMTAAYGGWCLPRAETGTAAGVSPESWLGGSCPIEGQSGPCALLPYSGHSAISFFMETLTCIFNSIFNKFLNLYWWVMNSELVLSLVMLWLEHLGVRGYMLGICYFAQNVFHSAVDPLAETVKVV